jgi:hypothetical protein
MQTDAGGRRYMKLIVACRNFANAPKTQNAVSGFLCNSGCANSPQCSVIHTLLILLYLSSKMCEIFMKYFKDL